MHLARLELEEFRAYRLLDLPLDRRGLRLHGPNGSGKSTLVEAIALLATTRSPRTSTERELIGWQSGIEYGVPAYTRCRGTVSRADGDSIVEVSIEADPTRDGVAKKQVRLGGRPVRASDAVGTLKAVLFSAEDVELVAGPPARRRRYLDLAISQLDGRYLRALSTFNRVLAERNSLLKAFGRAKVSPSAPTVAAQLAFWDEELVAHGSVVVADRIVMLRRLACLAGKRFAWLNGSGSLDLDYRGSTDLPPDLLRTSLDDRAIQALIARNFETTLQETRREEIRRGITLCGPHRDDFALLAGGVALSAFGSRGQQRLAVVALKLAEADLMTERAGEPPVVLLDDVLSELDADRRGKLIEAIAGEDRQLVITASDAALLDVPTLDALPLVRVQGGELEHVTSG